MNYKRTLPLLALLASSPLLADTPTNPAPPDVQRRLAERADDQRMQSQFDQTQQIAKPQQAGNNNAKSANNTRTLSITKEELVKQPDLVMRALIPALAQNNAENVALLYPIYQQIPQEFHAPLFSEWAEAILAHSKQHYGDAIQHYRNIIAQYPDQSVARFQLAQTLFENSELVAAEDQFQKLRSEPTLDEKAKEVIEAYLTAIANQDRWEFSGGVTYLRDPNINNAPKSGTRIGNWSAPEAESAEGVGFNLDLSKKWSWSKGFFTEFRGDLNGKYYWDNKKYNEATARGSLGIGFKNARQTLTILPFMEQTLYAGGSNASETLKRFSKAGGATLEWNYWLSPQWQTSNVVEYAEQRYTTRKHLNGNSYFGSSTLIYYPSAKQFWTVGVDYNRTNTRDRDDSYDRKGIRLGWGQEWGKGLSTRLTLSYAHKNYKGAMPIFGITQRNKEFGIYASIWHRAVQYKGITPRLSFSYSKVKSNHAFYSYDKARVFVEVSKRF